MAQSTILAAGNTAATSTDVVVAVGVAVWVGVFSASPDTLPVQVSFVAFQDTPGADNAIGFLSNNARMIRLVGPGTFRVTRPAYTGTAFGVFLET